ncbi:MAG: extradiol ring-cleavage dioxygenase [SAR202 cluster bacterium]|nr:extradiol ring-cleavage dioxygenase [SAR202 cluster bacterium]
MGEMLGLGLSHYPGFIYPDHDMAMRVKQTMKSDRVPVALKDPRNWPAPMQQEWGTDEGTTFAAKHRAAFVDGVRRLRQLLDGFNPDAVVIFGDDQYENFQEDLIPPFSVYIGNQFQTQPFVRGRGGGTPQPNVWGEDREATFTTPGHAQLAKHLTRRLLEDGFDMPYSYKFHHMHGLGHAFINTLLYLDYDRKGWTYPIVPFHVNAYGSSLVRNRGGSANLFDKALGEMEPDPPAPSPRRLFALGQAIARIVKDSPYRVALVGSSSWSHAFLTEKNRWMYPDVPSDRQRFEELRTGNYLAWRNLSLGELEQAGEHEILNWIPMVGAMHELEQKPVFCEFIESYLMNSSKCVAAFPPND